MLEKSIQTKVICHVESLRDLFLGHSFSAHIGTDEFKSINCLQVRNRMEQNISSNVFKFLKCKVPAYYGEIFHTAQRDPITRRSKFKLDFPFGQK